MIDLDHCRVYASQLNETRDCAVKATAIAAQVPYAQAHAALKAEGRRARRGTYPWMYQTALRKMGFVLRNIQVRSRTVRTIAAELTRGTYLVQTAGHVLCVRDGVVHDWTAGRLHKVREVIQVTREGELAPTPTVAPAPRRRHLDLHKALWMLRRGPTLVSDLAFGLGTDDKGARNAIDNLRRRGYPVKNVGANTFHLEDQA